MIAPDNEIRCPFCNSSDTELMSLFGQQLLTVQYYCNACNTPFERVKGADVLRDAWLRTRDDTPDVSGEPTS